MKACVVLGVSRLEAHVGRLYFQLKCFVLFWLSGSIDTSYISLHKTIKHWLKCSAGGLSGVVSRPMQHNDKDFCFQILRDGLMRFYSVLPCYFSDWLIRKMWREQQPRGTVFFLFSIYIYFYPIVTCVWNFV